MPAAEAVRRSPLQTPVQYLKGVGPSRAAALTRLGVRTVEDLLYYVPRRHEDRRHLRPLRDLIPGVEQTVEATVAAVSTVRPRRGLTLVKAALVDPTGVAYAIWYNQAYVRQQLHRGMRALFYGKVERRYGEVRLQSPEFEALEGATARSASEAGGGGVEGEEQETWHTGRLVPIYAATEGLSQRILRTLVRTVLVEFAALAPERLPEPVRIQRGWPAVEQALWALHFPATDEDQRVARERLAFEELLALQVGLLLRRRAVSRQPKAFHYGAGELVGRFLRSLPFPLTDAQRRAIRELTADLHGPHPMNRLLQGDVGSGKTVVAVAAMLTAVQGGQQAALMAPTEILAEQHYLTIRRLLEPLGVQVALLVGGRGARDRGRAREAVRAGTADIAVGTHALLEEAVGFDRLALVVVDEQHRFGVLQRARLRRKGRQPDVLVMTATPIPRTLALSLYGDLDTSVIDELPPGRGGIATFWREASARPKVYAFAREQIARGRQAYVVTPLVEESEKLQAQAAVRLAEDLRRSVFPDLTVGLLHGRMKTEEKDRVMAALRVGEIQVLVATTVIEVGIDVPNASVMVVEDADRFGLAQLHQLRGRVGRGAHKSYCILIGSPATEDGRRRMQVLTETTDGFRIAQEDLLLRGPGEILGTRQHGLADLRVADLRADLPLLEQARDAAAAIVKRDPDLRIPDHRALREAVATRFAGGAGLAGVG